MPRPRTNRKETTNAALRVDEKIYRNFKCLCILQGKNQHRIAEELIKNYTITHAENASEIMKKVAKEVINA